MLNLGGLGTDRAMIAACPFAWPWNVLGWPGVNVPAGFVDDGLPVGAQLLGPANSEPLLLSLAAQLEADQRWHELWPPQRSTADSPHGVSRSGRAVGESRTVAAARADSPPAV